MKIKRNKLILAVLACMLFCKVNFAQQTSNIATVAASVNAATISNIFDGDLKTGWKVSPANLSSNQWLTFTLRNAGNVNELIIAATGSSKKEIENLFDIFVTYDPMNLGTAIPYKVRENNKKLILSFSPKYGAHIRLVLKKSVLKQPLEIRELKVMMPETEQATALTAGDKSYLDPKLPLEERVKKLLAVMTPAEKIDLLREGWGIPGIKRLGIPAITKVEALHGFSYGSGATIFPQSIGMGATWNKNLIEKAAGAIADETKSANTIQAWSPVLDVAQDARWGRCEETYGEDPVLVTEMGGSWIKGFQSRGLLTTPKHFAAHGAPLGGRDSHDIGLSERELREIHLVPFREIVKKYDVQSIMMSYNDYLGVPVAKSKEILRNVLRDEWGFNGFIVSDCGAIGNLTSRKHYTALDKIEAANQALAAGIATNCGDTYNDPIVIQAVKDGKINMKNLDFTCATLLRTMFRNGLFENNPSKPLDWKKIYPGWNSPEHKALAREVARQSIVLLENKNQLLPLAKNTRTIAVIGPGADNLQPGDYTPALQEGQLKSVLTGIKAAVDKQTKVIFEKGCDFFDKTNSTLKKAVEAAQKADVAVLVLGDHTTSEAISGLHLTSGENHDLATLELQGDQQKLLEAVCATGKPVILILQSGRPYNLSYAKENCKAILVNWLPGQEGGPATADVLFGDYNPAGRLPMTFPRHVGQLPLYYNFKTSGRRYEYADLEYAPLYKFGYGLSYTNFNYTDLKTEVQSNGNILVHVKVSNTGKIEGDEVVQLYVTDMYASVKTRVVELKDFDRIHLKAGETKTVSFSITPYHLSLLNDQMDRVVEKGTFKIMVGGTSPAYNPTDAIKDSMGYKESKEGLHTKVDYQFDFAANFDLQILNTEKDLQNNTTIAHVQVKNIGTLTDAGRVSLFVDGQKSDEKSFELDAQQQKVISFEIASPDFKEIQLIGKYKSVSYKK